MPPEGQKQSPRVLGGRAHIHQGRARLADDVLHHRPARPDAAVLDGGGELITYCTIGGRAATAWFVLTHLLGRDRVRIYDGSWAEWGRATDTPIERP